MNKPVAYLNSNDGTGLIAFGAADHVRVGPGSNLDQIQEFIDRNTKDYIFMMLSYDLKNAITELSSHNHDGTGFPAAILWVPETVIEINGDEYTIKKGVDIEYLGEFTRDIPDGSEKIGINLKARVTKDVYLDHVSRLKESIQYGNIYEVNYCQEFYAKDVLVKDTYDLYLKLNQRTKAPFSAYIEFDEFTVMSGSPERFIKKVGNHLTSQPIKGTIKRGKNKEEDGELREQLLNDPKERAENVMIVDLVRNDLSRIAQKGSVKVDELYGIYSFETVHQMISTISCEARPELNFTDIIRATFPMGSMTGAPKISAMKLIEEHEDFKRGLYSGSVGYIDPNGDFDLNVVIRSLIYNRERNYLSCSVGGAITIQSNPDSEYQECFTKINAVLESING